MHFDHVSRRHAILGVKVSVCLLVGHADPWHCLVLLRDHLWPSSSAHQATDHLPHDAQGEACLCSAKPAAGCTMSHQMHLALQQCMHAKSKAAVPLLMC